MENNKKYNLAYIKKLENDYSTTSTLGTYSAYVNARKFYKGVLKIANGCDLSMEKAKEEISRLYNFLTTDDFKNEFGRDFDLIDMYLATNIQIGDLCENYVKYINKDQLVKFLFFMRDTMYKEDNIYSCLNTYKSMSKQTFHSRFYRPSQKSIDKLLKLELTNYNPINASLEDVEKAHEILLDLNDKYGVKYDDVSLYLILDAYVNKTADSYYKVAEKYKDYLYKESHVQKRCIPLLTRREKNIN